MITNACMNGGPTVSRFSCTRSYMPMYIRTTYKRTAVCTYIRPSLSYVCMNPLRLVYDYICLCSPRHYVCFLSVLDFLCVCIHTHVYVLTHARKHACKSVLLYMVVSTYRQLHGSYVHTHVRPYVCIYVYTYMYLCLKYMYLCMNIFN